MSDGIQIRRLSADDAGQLRELRLAALELEPRAFGASVDEDRAQSVEAIAKQLSAGGDSFVVGGFDAEHMVGMAGLHRETRAKRRHKAQVWGVFVLPSHRGQGVGRALLSAVVENAKALPGLRQIQLSVGATQGAARHLYVELGFQSFGIEPQALQVDGVYIDEEHFYLPMA